MVLAGDSRCLRYLPRKTNVETLHSSIMIPCEVGNVRALVGYYYRRSVLFIELKHWLVGHALSVGLLAK